MKVEWSRKASTQLEEIRQYIAQDSERHASRFVGKVLQTTRALGFFPEMGQIVTEYGEHVIREKLIGNYRIFYEFRECDIRIVALVHAARDIESLMFNDNP